MGVTKYIAPALMIGAGIMTGGLATLASGALIAGGTLSAVGAATNNKDLSTAGSLIGMAGGLGEAFNVGTADLSQVGGVNALEGASTVSKAGITNALSSEEGITQTAQGMADAAGGGAIQAASAAGTGAAQVAANNAAISQLGKYNLISGIVGGIGQGVGADQAAKIAAQTQANQLALEQERVNIANTAAGSAGVAPVPLVRAGGTGLIAMNPVAVPTIQQAM